MSNKLTTHDHEYIAERFQDARNRAGLDRVECVREAEWQNITKGLRRLDAIEDAGPPVKDADVYRCFSHVLSLDLVDLSTDITARLRARLAEARSKHPSWLGQLLQRRRRELEASTEERRALRLYQRPQPEVRALRAVDHANRPARYDGRPSTATDVR